MPNSRSNKLWLEIETVVVAPSISERQSWLKIQR